MRTIVALALLIGCAVAALEPANAAATRPNILILFSDDQRFDTIHALGNPEIRTPNLDRLVGQGVALRRSYIMGGNQGAVCVPSRAMLMTGRTLWRSESFPAGGTLPEALAREGYTTFAVGKWHNGPKTFARMFQGGANLFFGGMSDQWKVSVHDFDPTGQYPKERARIGEKFSTELFADTAIRFLRDYKGEKPFFLYVAFTSPHDPRRAPKAYQELYDETMLTLPRNFMPEHPFDNGEMKIRDEQLAPWPRTPEIIRRHIADYYAMITHLDAEVGRILEALRETGHGGHTIVVFAGDNGLALGRHGLMGKQSVYDHSVRVPLVVSGPGVAQGKQSDAAVYLLDLLPTLCDLLGISAPETAEGRSFAPVLRTGKGTGRESLFFAYRDVQRSVSDGRHKLIEYFADREGKGTRRTRLFDLADDPWEMKDLAGRASMAPVVRRLRAELRRWAAETGDPLAPNLP